MWIGWARLITRSEANGHMSAAGHWQAVATAASEPECETKLRAWLDAHAGCEIQVWTGPEGKQPAEVMSKVACRDRKRRMPYTLPRQPAGWET